MLGVATGRYPAFSFQTGAPETVYISGYNQNGDSSASQRQARSLEPERADQLQPVLPHQPDLYQRV